jgi:hypothetical protein
MLTTSNKGGSVPPVESGLHEAICYAVVDIGTVHSDLYNHDQRKIVLMWELPKVRIEVPEKGNMPRALSKKYTNSLNEKALLRRDLVSWRGKDFTKDEEKAFDLSKILGAPCQLNIVHRTKRDGGTCAVVENVIQLKGKKLKAENPLVIYGIEENGLEIPDTLPQWLVDEIKKSPEYQAIWNGGSLPPEEPEPSTDYMEPISDDMGEIPF